MNKKILVLLICLLIVIIAGVLIWIFWPKPKMIGCTAEAKLCPDGSSVGRTGPNCEFAECPIVDETADWQVYTNQEFGFEVKYPGNWRYSEEKSSLLPLSVGFIPEGQDMGYEGLFGMFPIFIHVNQSPSDRDVLDQEEILINGIDALKISSHYDWMINFPEPNSAGYYYSIFESKTGILCDVNKDEENCEVEDYGRSEDETSKIFNQMLSTFKFINN